MAYVNALSRSIHAILAYYRARTADQAAAALQWRLDHEKKKKESAG